MGQAGDGRALRGSARQHDGGALIGGHEKYGMSEQNYRTAKKILEQRQHLKILETSRNRKKSTNGATTEGTKVKLLSSNVWDINTEEGNERPNECLTNDQRMPNDKLRNIRKKKNEKEEQPLTPSFSEKLRFRENVQLTQSEYDSLLSKHGQIFFDKMLDALDSYKGSTGKIYKSDFHTMKDGGWVVERVNKEIIKIKTNNENSFKPSSESSKPSQPRFQPSRVIRGSNDVEGN